MVHRIERHARWPRRDVADSCNADGVCERIERNDRATFRGSTENNAAASRIGNASNVESHGRQCRRDPVRDAVVDGDDLVRAASQIKVSKVARIEGEGVRRDVISYASRQLSWNVDNRHGTTERTRVGVGRVGQSIDCHRCASFRHRDGHRSRDNRRIINAVDGDVERIARGQHRVAHTEVERHGLNLVLRQAVE